MGLTPSRSPVQQKKRSLPSPQDEGFSWFCPCDRWPTSNGSNDNTGSRETRVSRDRDLSRDDLTKDRTKDGPGTSTRDFSQNRTNDGSRNDTR